MAIDERITSFSDKELASLHDNVRRLADSGSTAQRAEAARLMPLIDAELAERKAKAPVRKPPVRKAAAKKQAARVEE
ncbi:MAG: hypothetical protein JNL81_13935 [Hyphomonadaceae bacterium]|nr:hypothetical protein [Hyphomonadaceae bacterium]